MGLTGRLCAFGLGMFTEFSKPSIKTVVQHALLAIRAPFQLRNVRMQAGMQKPVAGSLK